MCSAVALHHARRACKHTWALLGVSSCQAKGLRQALALLCTPWARVHHAQGGPAALPFCGVWQCVTLVCAVRVCTCLRGGFFLVLFCAMMVRPRGVEAQLCCSRALHSLCSLVHVVLWWPLCCHSVQSPRAVPAAREHKCCCCHGSMLPRSCMSYGSTKQPAWISKQQVVGDRLSLALSVAQVTGTAWLVKPGCVTHWSQSSHSRRCSNHMHSQ